MRQKLGRYRGNLDQLYIVFNTSSARNYTVNRLKAFNELIQLYETGDQTALAEFYGRQEASKSKISFLKKAIDKETKVTHYYPNKPAYLNCVRDYQSYLKLVNSTETAVFEMYSFPLLEGAPKVVQYEQFREEERQQCILNIAQKWNGIPLKGPAQKELLQDFLDNEIKEAKTFKKCCAILNSYGIGMISKQASRKDLELWPQYLTKLYERYNVILI